MYDKTLTCAECGTSFIFRLRGTGVLRAARLQRTQALPKLPGLPAGGAGH